MALSPRAGWLVVAGGAVLVLAVQIAAPVGVPLYDGVIVDQPYRFLHPTGEQAGSPTSVQVTPAVTEAGISPAFVAATTETPTQAQLIAQRDAFRLTPGAGTLIVSINPVDARAQPASGAIAGNVYRFEVTDQGGTPLAINPSCRDCLSLILRAPDAVVEASVGRFADDAWTKITAAHAGVLGTYQVRPTALGDYAIVTVPEPAAGLDPVLLVAGGALVLLLVGGAVLLFKVPAKPATGRAGAGKDGPGGGAPSRIPSKRRGPRRPPSGRSGQ